MTNDAQQVGRFRWRRRMIAAVALGLLAAGALAPAPAVAGGAADGTYVLRVATVAPKGTAWANEIETMARDIERGTGGKVKVKVYLSGSAGGEHQMGERVRKGHLDGVISGGGLCNETMPTMRALGIIGVFQSREESAHVLGELKPRLEGEAAKAGYTLIGTAGLGSIIIFSRKPITTMAELKATKLWQWESEVVQRKMGDAMGLSLVSSPVEGAAKIYDRGEVDGFFAVPMAALAFQWFAQARYITDLRTGYLMGCFLIDSRWFDALPPEHQAVVRSAGAKLVLRIEDAGQRQDRALMDKVFEKQGLKKVPVSASFRAEFFDAARAARDQLGDKLVPREVLAAVLEVLTDYRSSKAR